MTDITWCVQKWGSKCRECRKEKRNDWTAVCKAQYYVSPAANLNIRQIVSIVSIMTIHIISWGQTKDSVTGWYISDTQVVIKAHLCINSVVFAVDSILTSMEIIAN